MSDDLIARAQLFAGIEGGINFWSQEVLERSPQSSGTLQGRRI
jgi:hypothetical protein